LTNQPLVLAISGFDKGAKHKTPKATRQASGNKSKETWDEAYWVVTEIKNGRRIPSTGKRGRTMSDASRLETVVVRTLMAHLPGMQGDNRLTWAYLIVGLILGRNVQLAKIAERVNYAYKESSLEDRFRRFVANPNLEVQVSYSIFIGLIFKAINLKQVVLSIDTTKSGRGCMILMLGSVIRAALCP
jgi:hypothetical protein